MTTTLRARASEFAREFFHFHQTVAHQHGRLHHRARRKEKRTRSIQSKELMKVIAANKRAKAGK